MDRVRELEPPSGSQLAHISIYTKPNLDGEAIAEKPPPQSYGGVHPCGANSFTLYADSWSVYTYTKCVHGELL